MFCLRIATYNIHKGVRGMGPVRRLEIHSLGHAVEQFDADIVCLQEVRKLHHGEARHFKHWPAQAQADYLAPEGYEAVYRTNAYTKQGEHGNALLSRWPVLTYQHEDMSDHRLEQRGLLHVAVHMHGVDVHVIVVHLGLIRSSRVRQLEQLVRYAQREIPAASPLLVAGDFNDWGAILDQPLQRLGLASSCTAPLRTFPSRLPLVQFDHIYGRGVDFTQSEVPRGGVWARMSDHLPLIVECEIRQKPN